MEVKNHLIDSLRRLTDGGNVHKVNNLMFTYIESAKFVGDSEMEQMFKASEDRIVKFIETELKNRCCFA